MSSTSNERPLVSFVLIAYNQERFIREAVEGAFAQTYSPLEIILSDDCSSDRTFEIIREMAGAYSGKHHVVINRNPENVGLVRHVNSTMVVAGGDLIVVGTGDDISVPHRTETLVNRWCAAGMPAAIYSNVQVITAQGKPDGEREKEGAYPSTERLDYATRLLRYIDTGSGMALGCSAAYCKEVFNLFGPLPVGVWGEDVSFSFRALLLSRIVKCEERLVLYRIHSSNIGGFRRERLARKTKSINAAREWETYNQTVYTKLHASLICFKRDLATICEKGRTEPGTVTMLERHVSRKIKVMDAYASWWKHHWLHRWKLFAILVIYGKTKDVIWGGRRLLPRRLVWWCTALRARFVID